MTVSIQLTSSDSDSSSLYKEITIERSFVYSIILLLVWFEVGKRIIAGDVA